MDNPLVAVVIPVFNTESYVGDCLNSIRSQTYENFHVYIVDDGSTDNSLSILTDYASKDSRIKVYSQKNQGASAARNFALSKIFDSKLNYDYLCFLDSDDLVSPSYLECIIASMLRFNTDAGLCGFQYFTKNDSILLNSPLETHCQYLNAKETVNQYFQWDKWGKSQLKAYLLCNRIFKFSLIKHHFFDTSFSTGEDEVFYLTLLPKIRSTVYVQNSLFFYRMRRSSLSHTVTTRQKKIFLILLTFY